MLKGLINKRNYIAEKTSLDRKDVEYIFANEVYSYVKASYLKNEIEKHHGFREALSIPHEKSLSVVTVNYNNKAGLKKTIESVVNQSIFSEVEFIVVDAASSDGSLSIINEKKDKIDFAISSPDKGVYDGMNRGVEFCSTDFVVFLNSGDTFESLDTVEKILNSVDNSASLFLFSTKLPNGSVWKPIPRNSFWKAMPACHQSMVFSWDFLKSERYNLSYHIAADYDLFSRALVSKKGVSSIPETVVSEIEPVGISSDFKERTMQRWQISRKHLSEIYGLDRIDQFYSAFITTDGDIPPLNYQPQLSKNRKNKEVQEVEKKIIFLISMPRSGSTLLQKILESSPDIQSAGEPWVMLPLLSMYNEELVESKFGQHLNVMAAKEFESYLNTSSLISKSQKMYALNLYNEVRYTVCKNDEFFLDKTPRYVHIVNELASLLPEAKFICLRRNPAAVISSYAHTWNQGNYSRLTKDRYYKYDFEHGFESLARFCSSSYDNKFLINYEHLVSNPEDTVEQLFEFLDIPFDKEVIEYKKPKAKYKFGDPSSVYNKSRPDSEGARKYLKNITSPVDAYHLQKILQGISSNTFKQLGYDKNLIISEIESEMPYKFPSIKSVEKAINYVPFEHNKEPVNGSTIGIVITSYNNETSIYQSLESIANQTYTPDEIIVVDDCSEDASVGEIERFINDYPDLNVRLVENHINLGVSRSRHKAISLLKTKYVTTLDGDDCYHPEKIALELNCLEKGNCKLAFSDIVVLSDKDKISRIDTSGYNVSASTSGLEALIQRTYPVPRDMTFLKALYEEAGGFDLDINLYEDWALKQRLMKVAGDSGWAHSGGIGTIYDRRTLGLSGKHPIVLSYAQLLVLGRNASYLENIELSSLTNSIFSVSNVFGTQLRHRFEGFLRTILKKGLRKKLVLRLRWLWANRLNKITTKSASEELWKFSSVNLEENIISDEKVTFFIVTPVLNGEKYIKKMLDSVLAQSANHNIVHHVQDGASTDRTKSILEEHSKLVNSSPKYKHITFSFTSEPDCGMYDSLLKGFSRLAERIKPDDWVTWINCDDFFSKNSFNHVSRIAIADKQVEWISGNCSVLDLDTGKSSQFFRPINTAILEDGLADGMNWPFLQQEGTFVRGSAWNKVIENKWLRDDLNYAADWYLWHKLASYTELFLVDQVLATFCRHEEQLSNKYRSDYEKEIDQILQRKIRHDRFLKFPSGKGRMYKYSVGQSGVPKLVLGNVLGAYASKI